MGTSSLSLPFWFCSPLKDNMKLVLIFCLLSLYQIQAFSISKTYHNLLIDQLRALGRKAPAPQATSGRLLGTIQRNRNLHQLFRIVKRFGALRNPNWFKPLSSKATTPKPKLYHKETYFRQVYQDLETSRITR